MSDVLSKRINTQSFTETTLITESDLIAFTGMSRMTIIKARQTGSLAFVRFGSRKGIRYNMKDVEAWVKAKTVTTKQ